MYLSMSLYKRAGNGSDILSWFHRMVLYSEKYQCCTVNIFWLSYSAGTLSLLGNTIHLIKMIIH